ncbi:MAG: RluA family pseudouridine synthase [Candidatus Eisenbacteria bacterium]|nr:RluA family pseudouridine synthase [Candidatus Eisenbacteria bacterium]
MPELPVKTTHAGERLDRFLASAQADLSRSRIQSLIREGRVAVNGEPARASTRLKTGDRVRFEPPPPRTVALDPEDIPLSVMYEDDELLVIEKPAGLVVHPGAGVPRGTLVHALLHRDPGIADVGGAGRPGIVHRLDKDTSGLMVVARTPRAYRALVEAIRAREVRRVYRALVWGSPGPVSGELEGAIGRDRRQRKRMAVVRRGGKPARTRWRVLSRLGCATLIEARLDTGRTHQIRVHLAHLGHPVVGDALYGGRARKQLSANEAERRLADALLDHLSRQALHASELALTHPVTGVALRWTSSVPEDMARALDLLREFRDRPAH